jgi:hypothetical protein
MGVVRVSAVDEAAGAPSPAPPWRRVEAWLQGHRQHFDYLAEQLPRRRYGRVMPRQLRIDPAPGDPHRVVVFGPDGAVVHAVRGWAVAPTQTTTTPSTRMYPVVMDRVRQTLWVPEAHGQIVLLLDPAADAGGQVQDVDRLIGALEAVERQRRTEQTEQLLAPLLAPLRRKVLQHPQPSRRLQWATTAAASLGAVYLLFLPGDLFLPDKKVILVLVALTAGTARLVHTTRTRQHPPSRTDGPAKTLRHRSGQS